MIPSDLLVDSVVRVRPIVGSDGYNNATYDYDGSTDRVTLDARLEQIQRGDMFDEGRVADEQKWTMFTNTHDIATLDRVEWAERGLVFDVFGSPEPCKDGVGYHHTETTLRIVEG